MSSLDAVPEDPPALAYRSPESRESGSFKWWVVFMLWFVCFLNNGDRQAIAAIFPKLAQLYHFDKVQLGLIGSAFMWVYAIGSPISGYIGDRLKRKNLILGGCAFWSFITISTGWCSKLWQFITVRALVGAGETLYFPASMSLISDYHGPKTRSKAMSFHQSSVYAGNIVGSWITALIAERYQWQFGFYLFGTLGVALAFVLLFFLREPKRGQQANSSPPPGTETEVSPTTEAPPSVGEVALHIFSKPTAILLMLAFMGANFVSTIFTTWTPTFLVDKFHFSLSGAGLSGSAFIFVACAFGSPVGGILADRFSRRLMGGRMLVQAGGLLFGAIFVFLIGTTSQVSTLLTAMICFGFGKGLYDSNIFASVYDVIEPRARSTAAGLMNTVAWAGGAMGPLAVGWIAKYGRGNEVQNMSQAMADTGVVYIISAGLLLLVAFVTVHRDSAQQAS
jgi:MFS family permease